MLDGRHAVFGTQDESSCSGFPPFDCCRPDEQQFAAIGDILLVEKTKQNQKKKKRGKRNKENGIMMTVMMMIIRRYIYTQGGNFV